MRKTGPSPKASTPSPKAPGAPGLRRKSSHTLLSSSTVDPPQPSSSASSGAIFSRKGVPGTHVLGAERRLRES